MNTYGYTSSDPKAYAEVEKGRIRLEGRLASRKLWLTISYFTLICVLGSFKAVPWETLLFNPAGGLGVVVLGYLGVQGAIDAFRRYY